MAISFAGRCHLCQDLIRDNGRRNRCSGDCAAERDRMSCPTRRPSRCSNSHGSGPVTLKQIAVDTSQSYKWQQSCE